MLGTGRKRGGYEEGVGGWSDGGRRKLCREGEREKGGVDVMKKGMKEGREAGRKEEWME
jgi:hypothetical protein